MDPGIMFHIMRNMIPGSIIFHTSRRYPGSGGQVHLSDIFLLGYLTAILMELNSLDKRIQDLVKAAVEVKANAYCPCSNFRVGASLLTENDVIVTGCNVENASYGLSVCAERVAIMSAVSQGHTKFKAAAVSCDIKGDFKAPCGACRQFYAEFNLDLDLYLVKPDNTVKCVKIIDVLPMAFTPQSLEEDRI